MNSANYLRQRAVHANCILALCLTPAIAAAQVTSLVDGGGSGSAVWYAIPAAFLLGVLAALAIYSRLQGRSSATSRSQAANFTAAPMAEGTTPNGAANTAASNVFLVQQGSNGERFEVTHTPYRIGRATERNEVTLKHPSISRRHAQITLRKDGVYEIMDMESLNGLFVNDRKVKSSPLADGDIIDIGDLTFRFTTRVQ